MPHRPTGSVWRSEQFQGSKPTCSEDARRDKQSALVQRLVDADEAERRQILLVAFQTGELRRSEAADLLKLVERLAAFPGRAA